MSDTFTSSSRKDPTMVSNFKIQNMHFLTVQVSEIPLKPIFNFISRSRILPQFRASLPISIHHRLSLSLSPTPLSETDISPVEEHSFDVSYLINTFGWPPEFAISKAKAMKFNSPEKPERTLAFLKNHGFTNTQISNIVKRYPRLLLCNPEKTLLPKFEFLSSLGLSRTEITLVINKAPQILKRSLEKIVIPTFKLISKLVDSDDEAVKMVKQFPVILTHNPEIDNIQILLEAGVPGANLAASMRYQRKGYAPTPDNFRKMVEEVIRMGFDPCSMKFLWALRTIRSLSKSTWEDKVQVFKKYGWSDRDIFLAFEKSPKFIMSSKDKIEGVFDFLVNGMGMEATDVANWPSIIGMSLEKRIVPRCLVYQSMVEKGLCKRKFSIITLCSFSEEQFFTKIMKPCENEAPELWDLYKEMLNIENDSQI